METSDRPARALDRRARLAKILERDGAACVWCRRPLEVGLERATTEHLVPRVRGGPSWIENEVAACRRCNGARGHLGVAAWVEECIGRGQDPDVAVVVRALESLQAAILERGGRRRARPQVEAQLRRLRRR
ncbi:MAG: HNH endonuclease [Actinobacteria bacterium]|nr:HNH endonuclease [Actinomycetota bacterium]